MQVLWAQNNQCLCGTRCEQVSVLGGAVGTRAMAEPVRDLSLGGAEGLGGSRVRALQGRDAPGEGWAEGTMSVEGSTLRVSQGHTCPLTSVPPAQPSAPSIPFPSPHPLLQVLNSLLAHLRWPSPSCWSLHINISSSIPPSDPQSVPSASFQVSVPQPLVTPAHRAPQPHQQRAVAALLPDTSKGIRDSLILLPAAAVPSEPCLSACVQSGDPGRRIQPCLSPSVMAGDAMGLPLGS